VSWGPGLLVSPSFRVGAPQVLLHFHTGYGSLYSQVFGVWFCFYTLGGYSLLFYVVSKEVCCHFNFCFSLGSMTLFLTALRFFFPYCFEQFKVCLGVVFNLFVLSIH
jgi:hypothetical protein